MAAPIYMRCAHCGRLAYCRDGLCDACASYKGATGYGSSGITRPKCRRCGGSGKITGFLSPDTPCPDCGGTGKA